MMAPCSKGMEPGSACALRAGTRTSSAKPPSRSLPIISPVAQNCSRPARHSRQLPQVNFTLAGGVVYQDYYDEIAAAAARLPNVTMLGHIPYEAIGALFARSRVFLNTSSVEGFPNTFLQAWIRGVPVVTFFDPDRLVRQQRLGLAVDSLADMSAALARLLGDEGEREALGARARRFAQAQFSPAHVARHYLDLLEPGAQPDQCFATSG